MANPERSGRFPTIAAAVGGFVFLFFGVWAMVGPSSFYETIALYEPYNVHFIQDLGAFQLGLGATLLLAVFATSDALTAGLLGVGLGGAAHVVSHLVSLGEGGDPALDIPSLSVLGLALLVGGVIRWRRLPQVRRVLR